MPERELPLPGLDASNPLGFMAALGLLANLCESTPPGHTPNYRLSWQDKGRWQAVLHGTDDAQHLIDLLVADLTTWADEPALSLCYDERGELINPNDPNAIFDLKPSPRAFRRFSENIATQVQSHGMRLRSARLLAAYGNDLITDNNGRLKPTAFHFTAGQQHFLEMVRQLRSGLTANDYYEALFGPWTNTSKLPSLSWNAAAPRIYAYRASNPSQEKRGSVPAADWLAYCALILFPSASTGGRLSTTAVEGSWKDSKMTWAVWKTPLALREIGSLLTLDLKNRSQPELTAVGISGLYQVSILRSDQGGYGSFSPASVL